MALVAETVWGNAKGEAQMRLAVMVVAVGFGLAGISGVSAAPFEGGAIGNTAVTTDNVVKVQHWRWGSDGGGHWRWGSGGHWRWGSHRRHCKHRWWDSRWRCHRW
jgi:hypothetical protein